MKRKCLVVAVVMFVLTGCGASNESALDMNTTVTNEVMKKSETEELKDTSQEEIVNSEDSDVYIEAQTNTEFEGTTDTVSMNEETDSNVTEEEDPEYGHFIRHNENYEDKDSSSYVPMDAYYSYVIPEGYIESIQDGSLVYSKEESDANKHSLYVYTEGIAGADKEVVFANYDTTIKETFGEDCTVDEEEHNGMNFQHYLYDRNDNGYHMYANIYFYVDDNALIYVEFYDSVSSYDDKVLKDFMDSIQKAQ